MNTNSGSKLNKTEPANSELGGVICCGVLHTLEINWMEMEDGTLVLPYIFGDDGNEYRVNYCPSCGKYIRNIRIKSHNI